jgi:membrane-associated phospholipid phosphatase
MTSLPSVPATGGATGSAPGRGVGAAGALPSWQRPRTVGHRGPALAVSVLSALAVWGLWRVFVVTATGRRVDLASYDGAELGRNSLWQVAEPVLDVISVPFIAVVLLATMLLAVLRRRLQLAVQVAVVMGGANLTTQLLKDVVLGRPDRGLEDHLFNTLPSGHTTAAASVAVALVLVVPRRLRPAAALLGALYTAATGVSTMVGGWHRPSDAVAAVLVVLCWAGLASALSAPLHGSTSDGDPSEDRPRETVAVATLLLLTSLVTGAAAGLALQRSVAAVEATSALRLEDRGDLLTAYAGGALGVAAVTCLAFGLLLLIRRAAEPHPVMRSRPSGVRQ